MPQNMALHVTDIYLHPQQLPATLYKAQTTLSQSQAWILQQLASHRAGTLWTL